MNFDINTELSTRSTEFTPINFRPDHRQEVANAAMNEANDNGDKQPLSSIEAEDKNNTNASPASITKKRVSKLGKRTCNPTSPRTPSKRSKKDTEIVAENDTVLPPIPTSLATASEMDRMILHMRDEEKQPWPQINRLFTEKTGIRVGSTTLRLRWSTMEANFVGITIEDEERLLRLKREIEDKFEQEKWHRIVEAIQVDGGEKYPIAALQKKFKELSKNAATSGHEAASGTGNNEE
ncbi:hypothetical protein BDW67DRAFT_183138 [Aspergillus spinulosporus]